MKSKLLKLTIYLILTGFIQTGFSQITNFKLIGKKVSLFEKSEWDIELKAKWSNPYLFNDVALDMVIISDKGKKYTLPCYFISGTSANTSSWKARFAPREIGMHKYYFVLSEKNQKIDSSSVSNFKVEKSSKKGILRPSNNWTFQYDNGEHFRGIGENIGWESRDSDDSKYFKALHEDTKFNYEYMVRKLASNGGNYFRTWMCPWNLPLEWKNPVNNKRYSSSDEHFNPSAIAKIDRLINLCDSLDVHVMLAIDAHGNFMGDSWKNSNYNKLNGGPVETVNEFFTNEKAKIQYKSKLRYLIGRWGYSPAIGAWEFFNEIDHVVFGPKDSIVINHKIMADWHDEMSNFFKQNDPYQHIVTTSISHRDIKGLNEIKNIDLNQKHIYRHTDAIPEVISEYLKYGKPYVIGEYGYHWDWSINFNEVANEFDDDFKKGLWLGLFSPTPILPMTWWWEFFDDRGTITYVSKVREIYDLMMKSGNGDFATLALNLNNKECKAYGVICGKKVFIYLINNSDTKAVTEIYFSADNQKFTQFQIFDTSTGKFGEKKKCSASKGNFTIADFSIDGKKDCILIVE